MATQAKEVFLTPPLSIAGCQLWLDAADSSTITGTSSVTEWRDKTSSLTLTGSGSTYTTVSGYPAITFNGNQFVSSTNIPYERVCTSNANFTIFIVQSTTSSSGVNGIPFTIYLTGNARRLAVFSNGGGSGGIFIDGASQGSPRLGGITQTLNTPQLLSITRKNITTMTARLNGSQVSSTDFPGATDFISSNSYFVFISNSSGPWSGNMYEIVHYNRDLSDLEIQQIEGYLAWKWGLQALLSRSHPFFSASPYQTLSIPISRSIALKVTSSSYFLPTAISGCQLWMDAADSTTITRSGANISQWNDKANLYTGTATNNPQYNSNPINGLPTIRFDGGSSRYVLLTANNFNYSTMTYCLVIRWISGSGGFMGTDTPGNYGRALAISSPNVQLLLYSQFYTTTVPLPAGQPCILFAYFNGTTDFTVILNGTKTLFSVAQGSGNTNTNGFNIGVFNPGNGGSHSFDMGEGIVYNSILSDAQRQQVEGYLAWKWGLQSSLVTTHPNSTTAYVPFPFPTAIPKASIKYWSPTRISGTQLWLDGADSSSITMSTGVSQWNDKSGNGYNLTQGTGGSQPTRTGNYVNFLSNYYLNLPAAAINNASTFSLFLIFNPIASINWIIQKQTNGASTMNMLSMTNYWQNNTGSTAYVYWTSWANSGPFANSGTALALSTVQLLELVFDGTTLTIYRNGSVLSTTAGSFAIPNNTTPTNSTLGSWLPDGGIQNSGVTNFQMGELIYYNTTLSTAQRQNVEGYLAWKWGLVTSLPAGHPYINFPPSP